MTSICGGRARRASAVYAVVIAGCVTLSGHSGPPFPIVSDRMANAYSISLWTDPDATDDGSAGGQFWVVLETADGGEVPAGTRALVSIRPLERDAPASAARAEPVRGNTGNQFAVLVMDHEGPFAVRVTIEGPLGEAAVDAMAEATYDLRPPPYMLVWYLVPFLMAGFLWARLLVRRRRLRGPPGGERL
jgi:hypothetical protein